MPKDLEPIPGRPDPVRASQRRAAEAAWRKLLATGGIAGAGDLARRWGIARRTVNSCVAHDDFPAPVATVGSRPVWLVAHADDWRAQQPAAGRPRGS